VGTRGDKQPRAEIQDAELYERVLAIVHEEAAS
jgi:hypothetical protein